MLPTELGPELQQGKAMNRVTEDQRKDRWPDLSVTGPLHQLHPALFPSILFHSTEEAFGDPSGTKLWHCDSGSGALQSDPRPRRHSSYLTSRHIEAVISPPPHMLPHGILLGCRDTPAHLRKRLVGRGLGWA